MGIPLWRHHPYNPENWKKDNVKPEPESTAATQPRSIIRRATIRDPRTSARRRGTEDRRQDAISLVARRRRVNGDAETSRPETRHGEQDEASLLDDFPLLRRMPGRMFRSRTLRSPPPPEPQRQLPSWRGHGDSYSGLGDRERSWSPGEDYWLMEVSTLDEPMTNTAVDNNSSAPLPDATTAETTTEESEASAIIARLRQCADQITTIIESLRARTHNARSTTVTELDTLRHRLAVLQTTEQKLNELENYFEEARQHLQGLGDGPVEPSSDNQGFLVHAMPALRGLLEDLDEMSNNFDTLWNTSSSHDNTPEPPTATLTAAELHPAVPITTGSGGQQIPPHQLNNNDAIPPLISSIEVVKRQCRVMHDQLKSWREHFQRSTLEAHLGTYRRTMRDVEDIIGDVCSMTRRVTNLNLGPPQASDRVDAVLDSIRQELVHRRSQMELVQQDFDELAGVVARTNNNETTTNIMTTTATTTAE